MSKNKFFILLMLLWVVPIVFGQPSQGPNLPQSRDKIEKAVKNAINNSNTPRHNGGRIMTGGNAEIRGGEVFCRICNSAMSEVKRNAFGKDSVQILYRCAHGSAVVRWPKLNVVGSSKQHDCNVVYEYEVKKETKGEGNRTVSHYVLYVENKSSCNIFISGKIPRKGSDEIAIFEKSIRAKSKVRVITLRWPFSKPDVKFERADALKNGQWITQ